MVSAKATKRGSWQAVKSSGCRLTSHSSFGAGSAAAPFFLFLFLFFFLPGAAFGAGPQATTVEVNVRVIEPPGFWHSRTWYDIATRNLRSSAAAVGVGRSEF